MNILDDRLLVVATPKQKLAKSYAFAVPSGGDSGGLFDLGPVAAALGQLAVKLGLEEMAHWQLQIRVFRGLDASVHHQVLWHMITSRLAQLWPAALARGRLAQKTQQKLAPNLAPIGGPHDGCDSGQWPPR